MAKNSSKSDDFKGGMISASKSPAEAKSISAERKTKNAASYGANGGATLSESGAKGAKKGKSK